MVYQRRGDLEDAKWYNYALRGGQKDKKTGKNRVWGWIKLSQLAFRFAQRNPTYYDAYYEARYNLSQCSFSKAMKLKGDQRGKELARVQRSIEKFDLISSGDAWANHRPEFEKMLKEIQKLRQKKPVGFSSK